MVIKFLLTLLCFILTSFASKYPIDGSNYVSVPNAKSKAQSVSGKLFTYGFHSSSDSKFLVKCSSVIEGSCLNTS